MDIHEHGLCVEENKKSGRVKCIYCGKEMQSFYRLKHHLGAVGSDVAQCEHVRLSVREAFRGMLLNAAKRAGDVQAGNSSKRGRKKKNSSTKNVPAPEERKPVVEAVQGEASSSRTVSAAADLNSNKSQKCDFLAMDFKDLIRETALHGGGQMVLDVSHELDERMFEETLKQVQDNVKKIKESWKITGCSLLLDAWTDENGHDLVSFIADSPAGPVYLRAVDVSHIKDDVTALTSLVDGVLEEVGVGNVLQIIACSTWGWVDELGKSFVGDNKRNVFWSVSISHCIELMVEKIVRMDSFGDMLDKVGKILEFIKNNPSALRIVRDHGHDEIEDEFVSSYLMLEIILKGKNDLEAMLALPDEFKVEEVKTISELVKDSSFLENLEKAVKTIMPLIRGLLFFSCADYQQVGYVYDAMESIKESIAKEEAYYKPIWDVIDGEWTRLYPAAFYSTEFKSDTQVITGLHEDSHANGISKIPPAEWWGQKAGQHQELQSFAVKILRQTCEGASKYKLKRSVAEKLLFAEGRSRSEKQHLEDLAVVHYNLHLQSYQAKTN